MLGRSKRGLLAACLGALALTLFAPCPAQAQSIPEITPSLKKMLGGLPIADLRDDVQGMVGALKKTSCGGQLTGCYATKSGPLQLYFFTSKGTQQTFLLVIDKKMTMPPLLKPNVQKVFGSTGLAAPIISISTTDYVLDIAKMPPDLQKIVRDNYFNVPSLEFASGVQLAARADLGGALRVAMASMGVLADAVTMRAAVVMPIPTDLAGGAGTGAGLADAMAHGDTFKKAGADALHPEAFVDIQFAPNAKLLLLAPPLELMDATFFINNELVFGYKGNAAFPGASGKTLLQFQTPLTPEGAMDFVDFSFRMASPPTQSLADVVNMMADMAVPDKRLAKYGGGFIRNIESLKKPLLAAAKPLSVFKVGNPNPAPQYKFGDPGKPFPTDPKYFNIALAGPLADGGPLIKYSSGTTFMGLTMGAMDVWADVNGFRGKVVNDVSLKLGPLGKVTIQKMVAEADVSLNTQLIRLKGNYGGQVVEAILDANTLTLNVPANCVNPFEIKAQLAFDANTDISKVFDAQGGANVDPSKIEGCVGKQLEAAYNKIAGEYKNLGGYSAAQASQALQKINDDAARAYKEAKDAARNTANAATNTAANAFRDAGNAFKHLGGRKKKHSQGPDPRFAASVFDWDYYYDNAPDVVAARVDLATHWRDNGFNEGRQGSPEFSVVYYWNRYLDVQGQCPGRGLQCALQHWLDTGLAEGRQGSAGFSIHSYLNRYPDLIAAFGAQNYLDAMDHWQNNGEDEGRDGRPASQANGPLAGFRQIGGGGGDAWSDEDGGQCIGQYVTGWRVRSGGRVDGIQFRYNARGWAANHGYGKGGYTADVSLPDGEYVTRVDYRSGSMVDNIAFITNRGRAFGPYGGGGGTWGSYSVTPGEKLGCIAGRAGSSMDHLTFSSTGPR